MDFLKKKIFLLSASLFLILVLLQACESNPPTLAPNQLAGTLPTFTPTPCSGVFGTNVIESSVTTTNDIWFNPYTPSGSELVKSLSIYTSSAGPVTYELGVYAANASGAAPTTLLGETGSQTIGAFTGWSTAPINSTVNLSSGVTYWLASHSTNAYYASGSIAYAYQVAGGYGSLPGTFTGIVSVTPYTFSLYATVCP